MFPDLSTGGDQYRPNDALTCIETAVWLTRGLGLPGGAFNPDAALTSGQAALVLERAFGEAPDIEGDAKATRTRR